jgi:hypothetical protein
MKSPHRVLASLLLALPIAAAAQIYRCEAPNGVVEYSNAAPSGNRNCKPIDLPPVTTIPAPKLPPSATPPAVAGTAPRTAPPSGEPGATAATFPKVDAAAQRSRDTDRRRILEAELRKEEAKLVELREEFNNGEPERRGDERNYQKYLDRVQRLRDDIGRSESTVSALRRELASIRE